jgi:CheY-like chemotaxis protein
MAPPLQSEGPMKASSPAGPEPDLVVEETPADATMWLRAAAAPDVRDARPTLSEFPRHDRRAADAVPSRMPSLARVLVVEDERHVAAVLHDALINFGYTVRLAEDGVNALKIAPEYRPDVVLLDLTMPELPGDVVLDRLREMDPAVPVIIVTGNTDDERARATLARGAFDYVAKPFDLGVLARILAAAVAYRG